MESMFLFFIIIENISSSNSGDFIIEEVSRTINLQQSIITIENTIKIKKNSYIDIQYAA